jgi:hypothetical protein
MGLLKGWKVLNVDLRSPFAPSRGESIQYGLGQIAEPREGCGPLCVFPFEESDAMLQFHSSANTSPADKLLAFECEYEPSAAISVWVTREDDDLTREVLSLPLSHLPKGTALAKSVTLTRCYDMGGKGWDC